MRSQSCFFTRKEHDFVYTGTASLHDLRIGVIQDYTYDGAEFDHYIAQMKKANSARLLALTGNDAVARLLDMLIANRLDAMIEDKYVAQYMAAYKGIERQIKVSGCMEEVALHFAFSPRHKMSAAYLELFNTGMKHLNKTGTTQRIIDKYLSD